MARTAEGAQLTAQHRQAQLQLRAQALRDFLILWPVWRLDDNNSFNRLLDLTVPLLRAYHTLSSSLSAAYFLSFRRAEQITGTPTPVLAPPLDEHVVRGTLHLTGADMTHKALLAGQSPTAARQTALVRTSGTVTRFALAGGRDTLVQSSLQDDRGGGWARVTADHPCAFCALLSGRGPVYSADTVDFKAHDHCACVPEPHYQGSQWPGRGREFHDLYNRAVAEAQRTGTTPQGTSNDLLNAFRRAYEDRVPEHAAVNQDPHGTRARMQEALRTARENTSR